MTTKKPSFQFYPADFMKDPQLSMCQPATRGIWIDLLCAMHENEQSGELTGNVNQLSRICRCLPNEMQSALEDLSVTKTANVTFCNEKVTVVCRRMFREAKDRKNGRARVNRFRSKGDGNADVTPPSSSSSSTSVENEETKVSSKKKNGTRIPKDYHPSEKMLTWAKEHAPGMDLSARILEFKNYWDAKSGKDATKLDWDKTFQNRILQILEWQSSKNGVKNEANKSNSNSKSARDEYALAELELSERNREQVERELDALRAGNGHGG